MCFSRLERDDDDRDYDEMLEDRFSKYDFNEAMFWRDVNNLNFTDKERSLIRSIYDTDKIKSVCEENNITRSEYNKAVKNLKTVFKDYR